MSDAMIGYDLLVEVRPLGSGGAYTALAECYAFTPPEDEVADVKVTHFKSPDGRHEYIPGLTESGSASLEMNYVPGSATDILITAARSAKTIWEIVATYPNGVSVNFIGFIKTYAKDIPLDDRLTASVSLTVTGAVTVTAAVAPTNTILPQILGTPKDGVMLSIWPGIWTGNGAFTYQWRKTATPIVGATGSTYTPVTGDVGAPITCVVTCTNSAGAASATTAATANVASA